MHRTFRDAARAAAMALLVSCGGGGGSGNAGAGVYGPTVPNTTTPVLTSVTVSAGGGASSLAAGQTLQLSATAKDQSGNAMTVPIVWASTATAVATVNQAGLVTAVAAGAATISATATSGTAIVSATFLVTVIAPPVLTSVTVSGTTALTTGQTATLTATPKDQNGAAVTAPVTWSSSAAGVATVSATGTVTAVAPGTATITATATLGSATVSGTAVVTVTAPVPVLAGLSISPPAGSVQVGQSVTLTALPVDQAGAAIAASISWSSADPTRATVSQAGVVTGVAAGTTTVTATAVASGVTRTATAVITVTSAAAVLTKVTITGPAATVVVGGALQLTATATDQTGAPFAATVTWSSLDPTRATVSPTGLVTGVAGGSTSISVQARSGTTVVTDATSITVQALTSVAISGGSSVAAGSTLQLSAVARDQNGVTLPGATIAWSSNATGIATVNASTGLVTGVAAGSANITAQATLGSATASSFQAVTVAASGFPAAASVTTSGLSFSPSIANIAAGGTITWSGLTGHDVTFDSGGSPSDITGAAGGSRTFNSAGTFNYHCSIHGFVMSGSIIVH